ncbi:MAG TPA: hypothetical protein VK104_04225 [Burkholderiaceae bacterium]|nr:hypothetical protein [Burkholderiaceae bacterium]
MAATSLALGTLAADMDFNDLQTPAGTVDHVDIEYNAGHVPAR